MKSKIEGSTDLTVEWTDLVSESTREFTLKGALVIVLVFCVLLWSSFGLSRDDRSKMYSEMDPITSYWPKGQPPREALVVVKHRDGSIHLVKIEKHLGRMKVYKVRDLPDASSATLYEVFYEASLPVGVAEVDETGVWYGQMLKQK